MDIRDSTVLGLSLESYYDEATGSDWRDLVKGQADAAIQSDYAVAAEARKAGWTLRPEDQAAVEEETALIKSMAESDGYADADSYLAATVGAGCNLDTYQKFVETVKLAESYRNAYRTGLTFDQSEIQAAYEASPETFDMATFRSFYYAGSGQEQAEEAASKVTDEASFAQMARDYASADEQQTYADAFRKYPRRGQAASPVLLYQRDRQRTHRGYSEVSAFCS